MNPRNRNFAKKLISLVTIVDISAAIAIFSPTIFSTFTQVNATNPPAEIAQTPGGTTRPGVTRPQTQVSELDRIYVTESAQGGLTEVRLAQLALQKSQNDDIRRYAQQMIQEHTPVNQQLVQLATQKGITPPTDVGPKYQAAIARLSQLPSREFDQAYQQEAGINLHMEYLVVQRRQSLLGQDRDLKAFANKNIPVAQRHLQQGERLSPRPNPR